MACRCTPRKYRYTLEQPRVGTNFVMYPTCKDVNILAQYGLVEVIFPSVPDPASTLQVSILDCNSNTLVYQNNGKPLLPSAIPLNTPIYLCFNPQVGGYIATNVPPATTFAPASAFAVSSETTKEVIKK